LPTEKKQLEIDEEMKVVSTRLEEIRIEMTHSFRTTDNMVMGLGKTFGSDIGVMLQ
jgi:uncharacterized membrane-anchored protein YhcB (DUF1043 family)